MSDMNMYVDLVLGVVDEYAGYISVRYILLYRPECCDVYFA